MRRRPAKHPAQPKPKQAGRPKRKHGAHHKPVAGVKHHKPIKHHKPVAHHKPKQVGKVAGSKYSVVMVNGRAFFV